MNIFESLENLNVSEGCFDEIMNIVEEIIDENVRTAIIKKHGYPEWGTAKNKSAELMDKAEENRRAEAIRNSKGDVDFDRYDQRQEHKDQKSYTYDKLGKGMDEDPVIAYGDEDTQYFAKYKEDEPRTKENPKHKEFSGKQKGNVADIGARGRYEKMPRYQHFKKLARQALKGHEQEGTTASKKSLNTKLSSAEKERIEKGHSSFATKGELKGAKINKENPRSYTKGKAERAAWYKGISNPKELYRIGKSVESHKK